MTILTEEKKQEMKVKLIELEKETRQSHEELQRTIREHKGQASDDIDKAEEINERNKQLAESAHYEQSIRQIVKTLNNFEDYGYCLECGSEINVKRLEIQPATTECIYCKEMQESLNKRTMSHA